jgi:hypothetical protein
VIRTDQSLAPLDPRLLGTNVPAWVGPERLRDASFIDATIASGASVIRMPGGSWSNHYDWLACENGDEERCFWPWAARPSDFLGYLTATGLEGMWTVSMNGTAQEAAALVAFFNGDVDDTRTIGADRNGRDWGTVGQWAELRAEHGHADPVPIRMWEVGNEIYGAVAEAGPSCASFGWEDVWTCDGTEYVTGTDEHDGFLAFRDAMQAVDPDIEVGAVGVSDQGSWSDWGNAVMEAAGDAIDFYVVHHYAFDGEVATDDVPDVPGRSWPAIATDVRDGLARHGIGETAELAVTEYNLVSFIDSDDAHLMTTALNAFYLADTIGQMALNGVAISNQWNLVNGRAENGGDYGLIDADTGDPYPAFYAPALWSRMGDELVRVDLGDDPALSSLHVYGGRDRDGSARLLVINETDTPVEATLVADPSAAAAAVSADVMAAESADASQATFNGAARPVTDLAPPTTVPTGENGEVPYAFPAFTITLLSWS